MPRTNKDEAEMDMTPMIDVVFQLMIFFILTVKFNQEINKEIQLPDSKNGPTIDMNAGPNTRGPLVIEVNKDGQLFVTGRLVTMKDLEAMLAARKRRRVGAGQVMIRADMRSAHEGVRAVMDACSSQGIARVEFIALKEGRRSAGSL